jgi:hypothetical protein
MYNPVPMSKISVGTPHMIPFSQLFADKIVFAKASTGFPSLLYQFLIQNGVPALLIGNYIIDLPYHGCSCSSVTNIFNLLAIAFFYLAKLSSKYFRCTVNALYSIKLNKHIDRQICLLIT